MIGDRPRHGHERRGGVPCPARTRWASNAGKPPASPRPLLAGKRRTGRGRRARVPRDARPARGAPAGLAAEVAYTTAGQIECGRARYASSRALFERAAELLDAHRAAVTAIAARQRPHDAICTGARRTRRPPPHSPRPAASCPDPTRPS